MERKNYLSIETVFSNMKKTVAYDYYETDDAGKEIPYTVITHYGHNNTIENMQFFAEGKAEDILLPLDPETTVEIKVGQIITNHINKKNGV